MKETGSTSLHEDLLSHPHACV